MEPKGNWYLSGRKKRVGNNEETKNFQLAKKAFQVHALRTSYSLKTWKHFTLGFWKIVVIRLCFCFQMLKTEKDNKFMWRENSKLKRG